MSASAIEWTERTWNPIVGCTVHSAGCTNCYAMKMAGRLEAMAQVRVDAALPAGPTAHYLGTTQRSKAGFVWTGKVNAAPDSVFVEPLKRKKPTTWFVNSMSDLFHESVPDAVIDRVFAVMALCPQHRFQVLTKRADRMRTYLTGDRSGLRSSIAVNSIRIRRVDPRPVKLPLPNVWLGVSVEDQQRADERIPDLLATPAAVRFLSCEPLLGPVDIRRWIPTCYECGASCGLRLPGMPDVERCTECGEECGPDTEPVISEGCPHCSGELEPVCPDCGHYMVYQHPDTPNIDWVIVGGESGPGSRPMHPDWARGLRDQCAAAGVPFFFKQWGDFHPADQRSTAEQLAAHKPMGHALRHGHAHAFDDQWTWRIGEKLAGRLLDGVQHDGMPL